MLTMPQSPDLTASVIFRYIYALRPWSWTATFIPLIFTSTLLSAEKQDVHTDVTVYLIFITLCIQAAANAINTVEDFHYGVDTDKQTGGDRALVDKTVCPTALHRLGYILLVAGCVGVRQLILSLETTQHDYKLASSIFAAGTTLAVMYTAPPLRLKYRGLGDVAVFLCFGPLLMQFCAVIFTGEIQPSVYAYTVPIGVMTVMILHGNNTRDIENDANAGITTLAVCLGFEGSRIFYMIMLLVTYGAVFYLAYEEYVGLVLVALSIPIAADLCVSFTKEKVHNMDENTAKFHMMFGLLMAAGIKATPYIEEYMR